VAHVTLLDTAWSMIRIPRQYPAVGVAEFAVKTMGDADVPIACSPPG
jgi:hypothetical protein